MLCHGICFKSMWLFTSTESDPIFGFIFKSWHFSPPSAFFLWAKKSCFIPYLCIKHCFLTGQGKWLSFFAIFVDFDFLLQEVIFWHPSGRQKKVDRSWVCVNKCQDTTTIEACGGVGGVEHGDKLSSPVPTCLLILQMVMEHWIQWNTGCSASFRRLWPSGMWKEQAHGDAAKGKPGLS